MWSGRQPQQVVVQRSRTGGRCVRRPHEQQDPGTAKRVRHRVLVSNKGVAAARRRLEPGKCVVRRVHETCVREWCNCAEGMCTRVSSSSWRQRQTDHEGWRRAQITPGGAQFGTAEVEGSLGVLTLGGAGCVRGRQAPLRLSSSSSSLMQKTFNSLRTQRYFSLKNIRSLITVVKE